MSREERHDAPPRQALVGGRLVLPSRVLEGHALLLNRGRIEAIVRPDDLGGAVERVEVDGALVTPGLVDIHTHGALGCSFLDDRDEAFATILEEQLRHGVTALLATTSTAPLDAIAAALERTRAWMAADRDRPGAGAREGARLLGAHVEGPYFAAAQAGAQDPAHLRTPDDGSSQAILAYADVIRLLSYAPELPGARALTRRLTELGIVAAAGHAQATDADLDACRAWGLRHVIHMWSGQSTTVREGPWRRPGLLEAALASDDLTAEVIADGKHLPPTLLRLAYRAFGSDRLCIVSDATPGAGLAEGARFSMGEMVYEVRDGVGMMLDGSAFAGSTTLLDGMLRFMTEGVGVPLTEAVKMASLTPARVIGVDRRKGSLEVGKDADLALFEPDLRHRCTVMDGRVVAGRLSREANA
jgi:N-acetylglucosamine-6-phosphate deacetylase